MPAQTTRIDKIYFLIHPCCWAMADKPDLNYFKTYGARASEWYAALNLERQVNRKQKELIESMGPNEALIIYPIGQSKPMLDLIATGERELGPRCIVQKSMVCEAPAQLQDMSEPIRHFLDDEQMEGRQAYWDVIPEPLRPEIEQEIRDACEVLGYDWRPGALKAIQGNRVYAQEFADAFAERGLLIDPETVTAEAFGEGFEQCAMHWKAMIPGYLGWRNAVENNFHLSVSGFSILFDAQFKERISLDHDIRLFLWEKWHGLPLAFFARARGRLADPRYYVELPVDTGFLEVWENRDVIWPAADSPLSVRDGFLPVPVMTGSRKYANCDCCYLLGASYAYDEFRDMLLAAEITSDR
jgi:hypothetical protein